MEDLLEFLFGASGRINRAKYWRSLLILGVAGMFVGVILLTAAGIATPLFIIMVIIVFIPWLMWGIAIHTERLHDRDKSAWWLVLFYGLPAVLSGLAEAAWFAGLAGPMMHADSRRAVMGKLRTDPVGICRDRLPARHSRTEQIWSQPTPASETAWLDGQTDPAKRGKSSMQSRA